MVYTRTDDDILDPEIRRVDGSVQQHNSYFWQFDCVSSVCEETVIQFAVVIILGGSVLFVMPIKLMVSAFAVLSEVELG